jgi:hypothetical protein
MAGPPFGTPEWLKQTRKSFAFLEEPAFLRQQRQTRELFAFAREPAFLKQQRQTRELFAFMREPAFLRQQRQTRELFAFAREPAFLKQQQQMRESLAFLQEPAFLKQQQQMQTSINALTRQPEWIREQRQLRDSLIAVGEMTATNPGAWLNEQGGDAEVLARATQLVEGGAVLPSQALDEPQLAEAVDGDEVALLAGVAFIYASASPALRRKLKLAVASLAVATAFYIVAIAQHRIETAAENGVLALLSLWSTYNALLEAIDAVEAEGLSEDDHAAE